MGQGRSMEPLQTIHLTLIGVEVACIFASGLFCCGPVGEVLTNHIASSCQGGVEGNGRHHVSLDPVGLIQREGRGLLGLPHVS